MRIIKVPYSNGSMGRNLGCEKAPDRIVECLKEFIWSNDNGEDLIEKIMRLEIKECDLDKMIDGDFYLGGDHSVSYFAFKKFISSGKFKNPGLVVFDSHPDVFEIDGKISHEDWIKHLIDENVLREENVIVIGLRNCDWSELEYYKEKKVKYFMMKEVFENRENVCDVVMEKAREFDGFYLSVDIDVLDPSCAPGTGYLEPGGMQTRELLYFLSRLRLLRNLKRVDVVEVNPDKDINGMTVKNAAKIIGELL